MVIVLAEFFGQPPTKTLERYLPFPDKFQGQRYPFSFLSQDRHPFRLARKRRRLGPPASG